MITVPPVNVAVGEGGSTEFTCFATGIPPPEITWLHNGNPVQTGNSLIINNVNANRQGNYVCLAFNVAGDAEAAASLTIFGELHF